VRLSQSNHVVSISDAFDGGNIEHVDTKQQEGDETTVLLKKNQTRSLHSTRKDVSFATLFLSIDHSKRRAPNSHVCD
jgi:hypothetical protein